MHCHHSMTNYRISTKLPNLVPHKDSRINPQTTGHLWFTFANYDIQHYRNIHFGPAPLHISPGTTVSLIPHRFNVSMQGLGYPVDPSLQTVPANFLEPLDQSCGIKLIRQTYMKSIRKTSIYPKIPQKGGE